MPCTLHGLNAIFLPEIGWYRVDARGNRAGINAQFIPPQEQLAFDIRSPQEANFPNIFAEPLSVVVNVLQSFTKWEDILIHLPDTSPELQSQDRFAEKYF